VEKMKAMNISNDIILLSKFKLAISNWLKRIKISLQPFVITPSDKPAGV